MKTNSENRDALLREVYEGFERSVKHIPPKFLYDKCGSELFDRITDTEDYYPKRTELQIMRANAKEIAERVGSGRVVVEFGTGTGEKTELLLSLLQRPAGYVSIDVSASMLKEAVVALRTRYPQLTIEPLVGDFHTDLKLPKIAGCEKGPLIFFPGSTIGNFTPAQRSKFLERMRGLCGDDGCLLIGVDLKKDPHRLHAAYNDSEGWSAAFGLNLLERLNRDFGANFQIENFRYYAHYNPSEGRVDMHVVSLADQRVRVGDRHFDFANGESLLTEFAYKFTLAEFAENAQDAGFNVNSVWLDEKRMFSVQLLEPAR
ncbi:MAG: L-histidine N(alpha)-methyltransferase [Phycisphaerae bacterium]